MQRARVFHKHSQVFGPLDFLLYNCRKREYSPIWMNIIIEVRKEDMYCNLLIHYERGFHIFLL